MECQTSIKESDECQLEKCVKYDKYTFYDLLVQAVSHTETQPSNKKYFEPKGSIINDKVIQIKEDKTT